MVYQFAPNRHLTDKAGFSSREVLGLSLVAYLNIQIWSFTILGCCLMLKNDHGSPGPPVHLLIYVATAQYTKSLFLSPLSSVVGPVQILVHSWLERNPVWYFAAVTHPPLKGWCGVCSEMFYLSYQRYLSAQINLVFLPWFFSLTGCCCGGSCCCFI